MSEIRVIDSFRPIMAKNNIRATIQPDALGGSQHLLYFNRPGDPKDVDTLLTTGDSKDDGIIEYQLLYGQGNNIDVLHSQTFNTRDEGDMSRLRMLMTQGTAKSAAEYKREFFERKVKAQGG